jgi:ribose transport system substrate-binding protein
MITRSKITLGLLTMGVVATGFLLSGCKNGSGGEAGGSSGGKTLIAFVTNNAANFWTVARAGTAQAEKELPNVSVQFVIPGDGTAATQKSEVEDLLAKGVKGVAISPVDPDNQTDMLNEIASKAALITQDSDAPKSNRLCYLGTDNHAAGLQVGGLIKQALPNGGQIMLFVGKRDAQNAHDREQGIRDALQGSNIQIIDVRTDDTDTAKAKANAADTLVRYPTIAGLVGLWSYNGPAILSAVKDANKVGKVKIICFDDDPDTLQGIKDGAIFATVVQQPYQFGYQGIKMLYKLIQGDHSMIPASKKIYIPTRIINQANVADYQKELNKLLGK